MYAITRDGEFNRLSDHCAELTAAIAPHRGALLTELTLRGHSLIYFSEDNFRSDERPRCGMPVLFPVCGRSAGETVQLKGTAFPMPIHGFAHTSPWQTADAHADETGAYLTLRLTDTPETRAHYPYAFRLELTFALSGGALTVSHRCTNRDEAPLPFDFGYHPYFRFSELPNAVITVPGQEPLTLPDGPETGSFFPGHHSPVRMFDSGLGQGIEVGSDDRFNLMLLWGIPEKKFICIEPWRANMDGLNKGTTVNLAPGETDTGTITLKPFLED